MSDHRLMSVVRDFLKEEDWEHSPIDAQTLAMKFAGDHGEWTCIFRVNAITEQVVFYCYCPVICPEGRRLAMMEFLTRANYGMNVGNFELDLDDGEVRFRSGLDVEGAELTSALLRNQAWSSCNILDLYLPGILEVLTGASNPLEAIEKIEGTPEEEEPAN